MTAFLGLLPGLICCHADCWSSPSVAVSRLSQSVRCHHCIGLASSVGGLRCSRKSGVGDVHCFLITRHATARHSHVAGVSFLFTSFTHTHPRARAHVTVVCLRRSHSRGSHPPTVSRGFFMLSQRFLAESVGWRQCDGQCSTSVDSGNACDASTGAQDWSFQKLLTSRLLAKYVLLKALGTIARAGHDRTFHRQHKSESKKV